MSDYFRRIIFLDQKDIDFINQVARSLAFDHNGFSTTLRFIVRSWNASRLHSSLPRLAAFPAASVLIPKAVGISGEEYRLIWNCATERGFGGKGFSAAVRTIVREWYLANYTTYPMDGYVTLDEELVS